MSCDVLSQREAMLRVPRSFLTWSAMSLFSQKRDDYRFIFAACSLDVIRESASGRGLGKGSPRVFCCRASDCYRLGACHTASAKAARSCRVGSGSGAAACGEPRSVFTGSGLRGPRGRVVKFLWLALRCLSTWRGVCARSCRAFACNRVGTCVACPVWLLRALWGDKKTFC